MDANDNPGGLFLHSGEFILSRRDLEIQGRGMGFHFTRTYRSSRNNLGPLGYGWDANVFMRLKELSDGKVRCFDGGGRRDDYLPLGGGAYQSPRGFYTSLTRDATGYVLRNRDGLKHYFDLSGRLLRVRDRIGNEHRYSYIGGNLDRVFDEFEREVANLSYSNDLLDTVTDFTGRVVQFTYDADKNLVGVRTPIVTGTPNGNDFPAGKREQYQYDTTKSHPDLAHNLVAVIAPNEVEDSSFTPRITNVYGQTGTNRDRVLTQTVGGTNASGMPAGGTLSFSYDFSPSGGPPGTYNRTRVTDRNRNVTDYYHNLKGHALRVVEEPLGPTPFITDFNYNAHGEITRTVLPMGNEIRYIYDTSNQDRFQQGNLLSVIRLPDVRGGDQVRLEVTYTYEPLYNRVRTVTEARGNDTTYVPQNGGTSSPARYTTTFTYDYQEAASAPAEATDWGITIPGALLNLGDLNGDGRADQAMGNAIRREDPTVTLLAGSEQARAEGDTSQEIVTDYVYNGFGQLVEFEDPRGNIDTFEYYPEEDPDGDGLDLIPGNDPTTGGYLKKLSTDGLVGPRRLDTALLTQIEQSYQYDARGNVIVYTDGNGEDYLFIYNALDQVVQVELPIVDAGQATGFLRRFAYDANDNVVEVEVQNWKTDATGAQILDPVNPYFEHTRTYDILDNLLVETRDATRDSVIPPSSESESLVTRYVYDANENVTYVRSPLAEDGTDPANVVRFVYDERDLVLSETRGEGSGDASTFTMGYDLNGNRTSFTDAEDNDGVTGPEIEILTYDGYDRVVSVLDRAGNEETYTYDPESNVIEQELIGPIDGSIPPAPTSLEHVHLLFDELQRHIQTDAELFLPVGVTPINPVTITEGSLTPGDGRVSVRFEYDGNNRCTFQVEDDGAVYSREYDGADRLIRSALPLFDIGGVIQQDRVCTYDDNSNLIRCDETLVSPEGLEPPRVLTTHYVYDTLNRMIRVTDQDGSTSYNYYDSRDNMVSSFDARGALIPDPLGLYTAGDINDLGNPVHYAYDGLDRLWLIVQELHQNGEGHQPIDTSNPAIPNGLIERLTVYDANDRLVECVDGNGHATQYTYDSLNRLTLRTNADGGSYTNTYDKDHHVTSVLDENGTAHTLTYDGLDRLVRHDLALPSITIPGTTLSMLTGTTLRTFEYDGRGRLTSSTDNNESADPHDDWRVRTLYDSLSRVVEQDQNGSVMSSSYNADVRSELYYPRAGRVLQFMYDAHDQLVEVGDATRLHVKTNYLGDAPSFILRESTAFIPAPVLAHSQVQQLDGVLRIDNSQGNAGVSGLVMQQTVVRNRNHAANQQQLFLQNGPLGFQNLQFNWGLSSLEQIDTHDRQQDVNGILTPTFYDFTFGPAQEILVVTDGLVPVQTNTFSQIYERTNTPFDYNAGLPNGTGLRTQDGDYFYQWDGLGRLQVVTPVPTPTSPIAEYDYDAEPAIAGGRRVEKDIQNSGTLDGVTRFYYDEDHVIEETDATGPTEKLSKQFIFSYGGPDDVVAVDIDSNADGTPDALFFYGKDFNNNTTHLVDQNGNAVEFYAFDHLSGPEVFDPAMTPLPFSQLGNPYLFTGRRFEPETGLYYYRARYFDPENGEFLSRDPLGSWGDAGNDGNPMTYGGNDLWNARDPSGLWWCNANPPHWHHKGHVTILKLWGSSGGGGDGGNATVHRSFDYHVTVLKIAAGGGGDYNSSRSNNINGIASPPGDGHRMNKAELIEAMTSSTSNSGLSKADAKRALDVFINNTSHALREGSRDQLIGFRSHSISKRAARTGRNPQTGKEIQVSGKGVVKFKAGADLSKKVN